MCRYALYRYSTQCSILLLLLLGFPVWTYAQDSRQKFPRPPEKSQIFKLKEHGFLTVKPTNKKHWQFVPKKKIRKLYKQKQIIAQLKRFPESDNTSGPPSKRQRDPLVVVIFQMYHPLRTKLKANCSGGNSFAVRNVEKLLKEQLCRIKKQHKDPVISRSGTENFSFARNAPSYYYKGIHKKREIPAFYWIFGFKQQRRSWTVRVFATGQSEKKDWFQKELSYIFQYTKFFEPAD